MATGRVPTTANSPLTAKGDLFGYSTAPARLAVGNNGESLVADSSTSTGLRYQSAYNGNAVINSCIDIWQRGTSFTSAGYVYTADRWQFYPQGASNRDVSRQNAGSTLPTIQYCARIGRQSGNTATTAMYFGQNLESAQSYQFAGQAVTVSFYARKGANYSATSDILAFGLFSGTGTDQNVFSGYTGQATVINNNATLTTSWQRFSFTGTVASTATELAMYFVYTPTGTAGAADYYEVTGVQLELGSVATTIKRAGGTIQGELAACQRYYETFAMLAQRNTMAAQSTSSAFGAMFYKVTKRGTPTVTVPASGSGSGQIAVLNSSGSYPSTIGTVAADQITVDSCCIKVTGATSAYTAGQALVLYTNGAATIAVEAEL